jgi:hypothetical protein
MLDENKLIYEEVAGAYLPNWKDIDKNELVRVASDLPNGPKKDSYVSAIMLKYWGKIGKFYSKCKLVATQEDVHMWLTMAVLYALDNKPWENTESSIYGDKNGPDKVINRVMECRRITFYQQLNRYNRKINSSILSLDSLTDDFKDAALPTYTESYVIEVSEIVIKKFKELNYMMAFVIDAIMWENLQNREEDLKKFVTHFRRMDSAFCANFSNRYDIDEEEVHNAVKYVNLLNSVELRKKIEYNLIKLKDILKG